MQRHKKYKVIGIMSGTSLDGLDVCCVNFIKARSQWRFEILAATTIKYSASWKKNLTEAVQLSAPDLAELDVVYGEYIAKEVKKFIAKYELKNVELVASHGHTVFHQPERGFTLQIGNPQVIAIQTGLPVIGNFRNKDVHLGGQGAPLVPIGDELLFAEFDVCLNIGGIANFSYAQKGKRLAFDICFANMGLNYLMNKLGKAYDNSGLTAKSGVLNKNLQLKLNSFYAQLKNKPSLSWEIFNEKISPLLDDSKIAIADRLHTFTKVAAQQMAKAIPQHKHIQKILCTGGGVYNKFLIGLLRDELKGKSQIIIPDPQIIEYKEALVFAFLGLLKKRNEVNCLKSVTGAKSASSCGILYEP